MQAIESPLHPLNDPRLISRHGKYTDRPANDPDFLFRLAEKMEEIPKLKDRIYDKIRSGDLTFMMHDGQIKILKTIGENPSKREFLILCSRQLGKSFSSLLISIMHCAKPYGKRKPMVRIFCETEKQVKEIVEDNMSIIMMLLPPDFIKHTKSERRFKVGYGEIRIGLLAGARVDGKRGGNATLIITEECAFSPSDTFKYAIDSVIGPQLLRSGGKLIHITTSSKDEIHHIHDVIQPKCDTAGTLVNLTIFDNPQLNNKQIIDAFETCFDGTTETWEREYLCRVIRSSVLTVIPEFDDSVVNQAKIPDYAFWQTVIDFGGTRDKHGILVGYHDFMRKKDVICAESLLDLNTGTNKIKKTTIDLEEILKSDQYKVQAHNRFIDAPGQIRVDLNKDKFKCGNVSKGEGSFEAGIMDMRDGFIDGTLEVWPNCEMLIKCLRYGKLNDKRTDFERHRVFGHLDILAALMYFLRHLNRQNPIPRYAGKHSNTHFFDKNAKEALTQSQVNLRSAFR